MCKTQGIGASDIFPDALDNGVPPEPQEGTQHAYTEGNRLSQLRFSELQGIGTPLSQDVETHEVESDEGVRCTMASLEAKCDYYINDFDNTGDFKQLFSYAIIQPWQLYSSE